MHVHLFILELVILRNMLVFQSESNCFFALKMSSAKNLESVFSIFDKAFSQISNFRFILIFSKIIFSDQIIPVL
tara:strand:+ start:10128 stop:10349 length:222 start_codon:yes stop_codon:yes gene_type:complete